MVLSASQKAAILFAKNNNKNMVSSLNEMPIFFSVMLTIASTESGYGRSPAARNKNNFFGIMSGKTTRTFSSPKECFDFWVKMLSTKDRYVNAGVPTAKTPYEQIRAMALGGYYSANNDTKSTLPPNLQAKYGRVTPQESANWYYEKNKKMLDVLLTVFPIGKISNETSLAANQIISGVNV